MGLPLEEIFELFWGVRYNLCYDKWSHLFGGYAISKIAKKVFSKKTDEKTAAKYSVGLVSSLFLGWELGWQEVLPEYLRISSLELKIDGTEVPDGTTDYAAGLMGGVMGADGLTKKVKEKMEKVQDSIKKIYNRTEYERKKASKFLENQAK